MKSGETERLVERFLCQYASGESTEGSTPIAPWPQSGVEASGRFFLFLFFFFFLASERGTEKAKRGNYTSQRLPAKKMAQTKTKTITVTKPGWHTSQRMRERQSMTADLKPACITKLWLLLRPPGVHLTPLDDKIRAKNPGCTELMSKQRKYKND